MIKFLQFFIGILLIKNSIEYSALITMKSTATTSSISDYFIDFAECSCNIMPLICDHYCCCDSLCGSAVTTWAANYQCLTTSSTIQVPCGQTSKGFGAIEDLTCVYYSNRGRIGYYYSSTSSTSQAVAAYSLSTKVVKPQAKQQQLITALSLSTGYSSANQYLKISTSEYLYLPFAGIGGNCVSGLVNFTASGTYYCKLIVTTSNCATINEAYTGLIKICTVGDCSATLAVTAPPSTTVGSTSCDNIITDFSLTGILGYNSGSYGLSSVAFVATPKSVNFGSEVFVKVKISLATASQQNSGNPGYIIGKPITMSNGIGIILSTTTGICALSSTGTLTIPFGTNTVYSCPSPSSCSVAYYIDSLSTISLTVNKYASLTQTITVVKSTTLLACLVQTFTLTLLYSHNGWSLDPQYYIVGAILTDKGTSDKSNPTNKYLKIDWVYVDPTNVTTPPSNTFYTYFSYLWTPLKQKFGMS